MFFTAGSPAYTITEIVLTASGVSIAIIPLSVAAGIGLLWGARQIMSKWRETQEFKQEEKEITQLKEKGKQAGEMRKKNDEEIERLNTMIKDLEAKSHRLFNATKSIRDQRDQLSLPQVLVR